MCSWSNLRLHVYVMLIAAEGEEALEELVGGRDLLVLQSLVPELIFS